MAITLTTAPPAGFVRSRGESAISGEISVTHSGGLLLPPHWQTAAVLLGIWSAGMSVSYRLAATAGLPALGPGANLPLDVTFVARNRVDD